MKPGRLVLGRLLFGAAARLAQHRTVTLQTMALPALVLVVEAVLEAVRPDLATALAGGLLALLVPLQVLLAINMQRLVLMGPSAVPRFGLGGWGLREWRYLGWNGAQLLGALGAFLLLSPLGTFGPPGWTVALAVSAYVSARLALMLPGIAVDRPLELREAWRRGDGQGMRLAVIVIALPISGLLLFMPLNASELLPVRIFGALASLSVNAWVASALALAWRALDDPGAEEAIDRSAPPISVDADAVRGVLTIELRRRMETVELGQLATVDGLVAYHGRIRGVVIEVAEGFAPPDAAAWHALDAVLAHLSVVRVHEGAQRVALVASAAWAPDVDGLHKHFNGADVRWFPSLRAARATSWACGEDDV